MKTTKRKRKGQKEEPSHSKNKIRKLDKTSPGCPQTLVSPDSAYASSNGPPSSAYPYYYDSEKRSSNIFVFSEGRSISSMEECLKDSYKLFKEEVNEKELSAHLYQCGIIEQHQSERIREEKHRNRRCDRLVKAIVFSKKANEAGSFEELLKRLKKTGDSVIAESIDGAVKYREGDGEYSTLSQSDDLDARNKLRKLVTSFEKELEPRDIIDDLLVKGMLSFRDHEDIFEPTERQKRVSVLIDKILRNPARNLNLLRLVLRTYHTRLAEEIDTCDGTMAESETPEIRLTIKENIAVTEVIGDVPNLSFVLTFDGCPLGVHLAENEIVANTQNRPVQEEIAMSYFRSSVQGVDHCCVKIRLQAMSSTSVKLLKQLIEDGHSKEFIQEFILSFLTPKAIQLLQQAGSRELHVEIRMLHVSDTGKCKKRISKELIVEHFTQLATELPEIKEMSEAFSSAIAANGDIHVTFGEKEETKEGFLRTLLKLPEKYLCLFEQELWRLDRHDVIANLSVKRSAGTRREVNTDVIRQNFSFLLGEIEPRDFLQGLDNAHSGAEQTIDSIINAGTRQEGARRLLNYLLETPDAVQNFVLHAEVKNLTAIVKLFEETIIDDDILRQGIVRNYSKIVQEIDPRQLRTAMVEREVFSETEFDKITQSGSRVCNAGDFLKALLAKDDEGRSLHCFTVALEMNDYENLAKLIVNTPAGNEECQCWKPTEKNGSYVFKLVFKLQFKEVSQPQDSQCSLSDTPSSAPCCTPTTSADKHVTEERREIFECQDSPNRNDVLEVIYLDGEIPTSRSSDDSQNLNNVLEVVPSDGVIPTSSLEDNILSDYEPDNIHPSEGLGPVHDDVYYDVATVEIVTTPENTHDSQNLNNVLEVVSSDCVIPTSSLEDNRWSDFELNKKTHSEGLSQYLNDVATVENVTVRENTHGVQLKEPERHSIPAAYGYPCISSPSPTYQLPLLQAYPPIEHEMRRRFFIDSCSKRLIPEHACAAMWGVQLKEPERHSIPAAYGYPCSSSPSPTYQLPLLQAYSPIEYEMRRRFFIDSCSKRLIPEHACAAMWGNIRSEHRSAISVKQHREALYSEDPLRFPRKSPRSLSGEITTDTNLTACSARVGNAQIPSGNEDSIETDRCSFSTKQPSEDCKSTLKTSPVSKYNSKQISKLQQQDPDLGIVLKWLYSFKNQAS